MRACGERIITAVHDRPPEIETERLLLRAHRKADFPDSFAMWANPEVVRFIGGRPSTEDEAWGRLHRYLGHWAIMNYGYWAVTEKESGRFVGEVGFADFKRPITPSFDGAPEAGWALAPWSHGRGYATEALTAAHQWLGEHIHPERTVCIIDDANAPSLRIAEKFGYRLWTRTDFKGSPITLFERGR